MSLKAKTFKKLMVHTLTTNFREAVRIETVCLDELQKGEILIKNKFVGVNIDDINVSKGRYFAPEKLPYGIGFEGLGEIIKVANDVTNLSSGQHVVYMSDPYNAYSEYLCVPASTAFPVPAANPGYLALLASGLTAAIGLDKEAQIKAGEKVLITAATGGVGHIAVQWAKAAGCYVIGTCSSDEKAEILKKLKCDRVINYKKEDIVSVLADEHQKGVDVIWETHGDNIKSYFNHLAVRGRLIVVGCTTDYNKEEKEIALKSTIPLQQLLFKSVSIHGYLVLDFEECYPAFFKLLCDRFENGSLKPIVDDGKGSTGTEFFGMEGIIRGVEHVQNGKNVGKVIVRVS